METFIKEFNFKDEDMHLCDDLIQFCRQIQKDTNTNISGDRGW